MLFFHSRSFPSLSLPHPHTYSACSPSFIPPDFFFTESYSRLQVYLVFRMLLTIFLQRKEKEIVSQPTCDFHLLGEATRNQVSLRYPAPGPFFISTSAWHETADLSAHFPFAQQQSSGLALLLRMRSSFCPHLLGFPDSMTTSPQRSNSSSDTRGPSIGPYGLRIMRRASRR